MKKIISFSILIFLVTLAFDLSGAGDNLVTSIGTSRDTIATINANDTSRTFLNPGYDKAYMMYKRSTQAEWRVAQIDFPLQSVSQLRVLYLDTDSTATVQGLINSQWQHLPIYNYSSTLSRTLDFGGGGTAWISFWGYR